MMQVKKYILILVIIFLTTHLHGQAIKVEVKQEGANFKLYRGGKPFYIKGAGGQKYMDRLVSYGGNSIRTWGAEGARQVLDKAQKYGLTVMIGLWVQHERHGFDYNNTDKVKEQLENFTAIVKDLKDHPALLMWGIGNEVDLNYTNTKVWDAIQDIARMIHQVDGMHPTTTITAGIDKDEIKLINEKCSDIDIYSVNTYGDLPAVPQKVRDFGWTKSYIVTEWGPTGHWEVPQTEWGAYIEQTSSEKAKSYRDRYDIIRNDSSCCLGSYVFLWGQKQEKTATWYGLFAETGEETPAVDEMIYSWSGKYPDNTAPKIVPIKINNMTSNKSVVLVAHSQSMAEVTATDADKDPLMYDWEIYKESTSNQTGGDAEEKPAKIPAEFKQLENGNKVSFKVPQPGHYRLFVTVYDGHNNIATANFPFSVE